MERFGQVFYIFLQRLLPKLEVFALFPQCFGHPLGLFTLCHDFILFLLQRLKFLLPGLSFVSRCFEMFFSEDTPRSMPRTSAQIVCISMASSDVVLILFPVEWSYQSNTIWAWRFGFHTSPANAPRPYGWQSVQVSPRTSLGIFSQVPAVLPWSYPL